MKLDGGILLRTEVFFVDELDKVRELMANMMLQNFAFQCVSPNVTFFMHMSLAIADQPETFNL